MYAVTKYLLLLLLLLLTFGRQPQQQFEPVAPVLSFFFSNLKIHYLAYINYVYHTVGCLYGWIQWLPIETSINTPFR